MTINNRYKLQTEVARGRNVYEVLSEILTKGDTIDELDRYILEKMRIQENGINKEKDEDLMNRLEKKVVEVMDDLLGSWK